MNFRRADIINVCLLLEDVLQIKGLHLTLQSASKLNTRGNKKPGDKVWKNKKIWEKTVIFSVKRVDS